MIIFLYNLWFKYIQISTLAHLDYNYTLWSPSQLDLIKKIEAIQNRFLKFVSKNCQIPI